MTKEPANFGIIHFILDVVFLFLVLDALSSLDT